MQRPPLNISIAFGILTLSALSLIACGSFFSFALLMLQYTSARITTNPASSRVQSWLAPVLIMTTMLLMSAGIWAAITATGLLKRKVWGLTSGRFYAASSLSFGLLLTIFVSISFIVSGSTVKRSQAEARTVSTMLRTCGSSGAMLMLTSTAILACLRRKQTSVWFSDFSESIVESAASRPQPLSWTVQVIAWLSLLGAVIDGMYAFLHPPIFIFGFILQGAHAAILDALVSVSALVIGLGLLTRREWARFGMIGFTLAVTANDIFLLLISERGRWASHGRAQTGSGDAHLFSLSPIPFFTSLLLSAAILYILHRHRKQFLNS